MTSHEMLSPVSEHPAAEVKSKTPLIGEEGLRQKESITLPDGQSVTVRAEQQKRALRLLITAFNEGKPFVTFEDILGFDLTKGIPLSPLQRQTLSRAIRTLRQNTLTGTGWDIQSITVKGKGVETRPNGYTLENENAQKVDDPELILQSFLENNTELIEVVTDGPRKASILEEAKQQINSLNPQKQITFLEKTFAILSDPNPEHQNKRDASLELLNIMDLKSIDPKELAKTYIKAVSNLRENLNQDSDIYGEIDALLQAGKTIAPFIENSKAHITQSWNRVAKTFTGDDRKKILDDIEEIRQLIPGKFSEFDTKVLMLAQTGLRSRDIATELFTPQLRVTVKDIQRSKNRLKNNGIRLKSFNRPEGR